QQSAVVDDGEIQQPSATSFIGSDRDLTDRKQASGEGVAKSASQAADAPMASRARTCRSGITTSDRPAPKLGRNPSDKPRSSCPHQPQAASSSRLA
ncbi:hypothetical protein ACLOJK_019659, partial [Asimina triloba]